VQPPREDALLNALTSDVAELLARALLSSAGSADAQTCWRASPRTRASVSPENREAHSSSAANGAACARRRDQSGWCCEHAHQQHTEELDFEHVEGSAWREPHHHALKTPVSFTILQHLRLAAIHRRGKRSCVAAAHYNRRSLRFAAPCSSTRFVQLRCHKCNRRLKYQPPE
jgi:hypothetical protein